MEKEGAIILSAIYAISLLTNYIHVRKNEDNPGLNDVAVTIIPFINTIAALCVAGIYLESFSEKGSRVARFLFGKKEAK